MKAIQFLLLVLLSFLGNLIFGQSEPNPQRWYIGLSAGSGISGISSSSFNINVSNYTGFVGGAFLQYQFNEQFSLRLGAEFDQRRFGLSVESRGLRYDDTSTYICYQCSYNYSITYSSFSLSFPLQVQYSQFSKNLGLTFRGGLYYSLLLKSYHDGIEELYIDPVQGLPFYLYDSAFEPGFFRAIYTGEVTDLISTYDAGIIVGVTCTYMLNKKIALLIEGNLQVGFQSVFENPAMVSLLHRGYQFRGGLIYRLTFNRVEQ